MRFVLTCLMIGAAALVQALPAADASTEQRGLEIAREAEQRIEGYSDQRGEAELLIRTGDGDQAIRRLRARSMQTENGSLSLTVVEEPKDVAGTALLTHSYGDKPAEQWLYLPALARVKRIAAGNRSGAFMGSEFSYEDFTARPVEKFDFKLLREEKLDGNLAYVIERIPKSDTDSSYSKHIAWLDKQHYRTLKVDFYNQAGQLLKTLRARDFKQYPNGQWRASELTMANHQTGGESVLTWSHIEFDNGFTKRDFSIAALKRAR